MKLNNYNIGYLYALLYSFSIAISSVYISEDYGLKYNVYTLLFFSSVISILIFNIINYKRIKMAHKSIFIDYKIYLIMALIMAFCWLFTYIGIIYINASTTFILIPISASLLSFIKKRNLVLTIISLILLLIIYKVIPQLTYINISAPILAGFAFYLYFKYSNLFIERNNLTPIDVLSIRSYLLILTLTPFIILNNQYLLQTIYSFDFMITISVIAVFNLTIPNIFSQISAKHIGADSLSTMNFLTPMMAFFLEKIHNDSLLTYNSLYILVLFMIVFIFLNIKIIYLK